jgi:thiamine biosynthesis lipoprotein
MSRTRNFARLYITSLCLVALSACDQKPQSHNDSIQLTGKAMGTTYTIQCNALSEVSTDQLQIEIDTCLNSIEAELSNWREDSWITAFNNSPSHKTVDVPDHAYRVLTLSLQLAEQTHGALDPTVSPLVELWGFGVSSTGGSLPTEASILETKQRCGYAHLRINYEKRQLSKTIDGLKLNLSAVAKGDAVDRICERLEQLGATNYLVELGGEVRARGNNPKGEAWRVGIAQPNAHFKEQQTYQAISLKNEALATSGNYQQSRRINGKSYTHIIDPRTGYPINHLTRSASVRAPICAIADGLSTACMVLDPAEAIKLVETIEQTELLLIIAAANGSETTVTTSGWNRD